MNKNFFLNHSSDQRLTGVKYLYFLIIGIVFLKAESIQTGYRDDYPDLGSPTKAQEEEKKIQCFCAWCPCWSQPECLPTRSDCRFYNCCKPCTSTSDRLQSNCGSSNNQSGHFMATLCCPCVVQDIK